MIKIQKEKVYQQHEMLNMANYNMIDYFESYTRNRSKKNKPVVVLEVNAQQHPRRILTDAFHLDNYETIISGNIILMQRIKYSEMFNKEKKELQRRKENNHPINTDNQMLHRILQSKIMMVGSKKIAKHIQQNNHQDGNQGREDGQKEIYQKIRECITFQAHQSILQEKKLTPQLHVKRKDEGDQSKRGRQLLLPSISTNNCDYSSVDKRNTSKSNNRINSQIKIHDDRQYEQSNEMKRFTSQRINEIDLAGRNSYADVDYIQLDSTNIMNNSSFKNIDFSEIQKQSVILQAEKQQIKESQRQSNLNKGFERLNFISKRQRSQLTPKQPFIGLVFQDYQSYTPIHNTSSRRSPIIQENDYFHSIDPNLSLIDQPSLVSTQKKSKYKKNINQSFL